MTRSRLFVLSLAFAFVLDGFPRLEWSQTYQDEASLNPDVKVRAILDTILKRGEGSIGGVKTSTWVAPTQADVESIKELGLGAIPPLDHALDSRRPFEQFLVVRLLGAIGGAEIVPTLKRALEPGRANSVRMAALSALRGAPESLALPIIRNALNDSNPLVARRAHDLLTNYYHALPSP